MLALNKNSIATSDGLSEQNFKNRLISMPLHYSGGAIHLYTYHGRQYWADQMDSFSSQSFSTEYLGLLMKTRR